MMAFLDYICAVLVKIVNTIFHYLPIRIALWLGRQCGILAYFLSTPRKIIAYSNLRAAFCKEKSPSELKKITIENYQSLTEVFAEILSLTKINEKYINKYIEIVNPNNMYKIENHPRGIVLLTAHFGNWELSTVTSVMHGYPLYLLARDQKMVKLNELLNLLRESKGNVVIRKGMDIKNIFRVLHEGKSLGILADQNAGMSGELIDFFRRPASTATGPYRFAQKSGAWILPAFIHRIQYRYTL